MKRGRVLGVCSLLLASTGAAVGQHQHAPKAVVAATLSPAAEMGRIVFDRVCAQCHGANAAGTDKGPPLIHPHYAPAHHADAAFRLAVKNGVRSHHWRLGDMPPQPQVTDQEIGKVIQYVREVQRANGIE